MDGRGADSPQTDFNEMVEDVNEKVRGLAPLSI